MEFGNFYRYKLNFNILMLNKLKISCQLSIKIYIWKIYKIYIINQYMNYISLTKLSILFFTSQLNIIVLI